MSRHSGCWVGLKLVTDVVESSGSVYVGPGHPGSVLPPDPVTAPGGLGIRRFDMALAQEDRLHTHKLHAALAYARVNGINRIVVDGPAPRLGVVTAGKS